MRKNYLSFILPACMLLFSFCKEDWLEGKPSKSLVVPNTVEDYQKLLNNRSIFGNNTTPCGELSADDYYVLQATWDRDLVFNKNLYIWADDLYEGQSIGIWNNGYKTILNANVIIEGFNGLDNGEKNSLEGKSVLGQALFYRAWSYFNLAQIFCKPFIDGKNDADQGLPLKLTSNVDEKITRSTLKQTYDQIIDDLNQALILLPATQVVKTRPSEVAVLALFARIYLAIENYSLAEQHASSAREKQSELLDYNSLNTAVNYPLPLFNKEVIWHAELGLDLFLPNLSGLVDSLLYMQYAENDIRKEVYFIDRPAGKRFTGSYGGAQTIVFCGLATDEMYLIDAECKIRNGKIQEGLNLLNKLLRSRYKTTITGESLFVPITANNETDALKAILLERRKSLILRNVRWSDLRRLNRDPRFEKTLTRNLGTQVYQLPPNHPNYTLLIEPVELKLLGLEQTQR